MTGKLFATIGLVVAAIAAASIEPAKEKLVAVPMNAENGKTYLVEPHETLDDAIARAAALQEGQSTPEEESGHCVPEPLETKPPGSVACKCYELTECKGNESHTCKRHCKKDLCECCSI